MRISEHTHIPCDLLALPPTTFRLFSQAYRVKQEGKRKKFEEWLAAQPYDDEETA